MEIPFNKEMMTTNSIVVSRGYENVGTFKYMDDALYFLEFRVQMMQISLELKVKQVI